VRSCCAPRNSVIRPLNSNPFLIFLVITTSGHVRRIFHFIVSSANGCKERRVAVEYTYECVSEGNALEMEDGEAELLPVRLWMGTYNPRDGGEDDEVVDLD